MASFNDQVRLTTSVCWTMRRYAEGMHYTLQISTAHVDICLGFIDPETIVEFCRCLKNFEEAATIGLPADASYWSSRQLLGSAVNQDSPF